MFCGRARACGAAAPRRPPGEPPLLADPASRTPAAPRPRSSLGESLIDAAGELLFGAFPVQFPLDVVVVRSYDEAT